MAKKDPAVGGNLLAALGKTNATKKAVKNTKGKRAHTGEPGAAIGGQQHGELKGNSVPDMPTHNEMTKDEARYAKRNATRNWIEGKLSNKKHAGIHERANQVLTNKVPKIALPKGW
jgi:hypothetical protein